MTARINSRAPFVGMSASERAELARLLPKASAEEGRRLRAIQMLAEGSTIRQTSEALGVGLNTVAVWIAHYKTRGPRSLLNAPPGKRLRPLDWPKMPLNDEKPTNPAAKNLTARDLAALKKLVETGPAAAALRARSILSWLSGKTLAEVANEYGVHLQTVSRWAGQFRREGKAGLLPAIDRPPLTEEQRTELLRFAKTTRSKREERRALAILASGSGMAQNAAAKEFKVSPSTVESWVSKYRKEGLSAIKDFRAQPPVAVNTNKRGPFKESPGASKIDMEMVKARLAGETLVSIAQRFNVSKQRVHARTKAYLTRSE